MDVSSILFRNDATIQQTVMNSRVSGQCSYADTGLLSISRC